MKTLIIDYGMGNLLSVKNAFERCGSEVVISHNPQRFDYDIDNVVLPGVGSFNDGMKNLREYGWLPIIQKTLFEEKVPLLGICLGMQLLADKSYESGVAKGLGLIPGEVIKLDRSCTNEKIPHIGWNEIDIIHTSSLFDGINNRIDFYFVHSYHFSPKYSQNILALTPYCGNFVSAIHFENFYGVQFHPEKSQRPGLKLISNFLNISR